MLLSYFFFVHPSFFLNRFSRLLGCRNMYAKYYAGSGWRVVKWCMDGIKSVNSFSPHFGNSCKAQLWFPQVGSCHTFGVCVLQVALCHHRRPAYPASLHFIGLLSIGTHITWQTWATGAKHMVPITLIVGEHWRDQPEDKEAIHG